MVLLVRISDIAKVDTVGRNTIITPLSTPGIDSGRVTLKNTLTGLAPRSWAASA